MFGGSYSELSFGWLNNRFIAKILQGYKTFIDLP